MHERVALDAADGAQPLVVLNGDFHWFDIGHDDFDRIEAEVTDTICLAGNVEAELGDPDVSAGCGCAYPDFVDDATVERSNTIMATLQATVAARPAAAARLAALPRLLRLRLGSTTVGVIHGDPVSLAGWRLAIENVTGRDPTDAATVRDWAQRGGVDAFACSHTCLPWVGVLGDTPVVNNGSGGMPNFRDRLYGLATRIAPAQRPAGDAVLAIEHADLRYEAIPLRYDGASWWARFSRAWPPGSAAMASYGERIRRGPDFTPAQAQVGP